MHHGFVVVVAVGVLPLFFRAFTATTATNTITTIAPTMYVIMLEPPELDELLVIDELIV